MRRRPASAARSPSLSIDARRTSGSTVGSLPTCSAMQAHTMPGLRVPGREARQTTMAMHPTGRPVRCSGPCSSGGQLWPPPCVWLVASGVLGARPACSFVVGPHPALAAGCTRPAPSADGPRREHRRAAEPGVDRRRPHRQRPAHRWPAALAVRRHDHERPRSDRWRRLAVVHGAQLGHRPGARVPDPAPPGQRPDGRDRGSPSSAREWSWPGDGYARNGTVWVYATRLGEIGPGVFGFEARAVDLVESTRPPLTIRRVHRNRYAAAPVLLGSSVTTDGTWTYVYGRDERGSKRNTYVARVPAANPLATTTYWTGRDLVDRPRPGPAHLHDRRGRRTGVRRSRSGLRGQAVRGGGEGRRVPRELGRAVHRAGTGRTLGQGHDAPGRPGWPPTPGRGPTWRRSTASTRPRAAST